MSFIADKTCDEGSIRLIGGHSVKEGRVQVCANDECILSVVMDGARERLLLSAQHLATKIIQV